MTLNCLAYAAIVILSCNRAPSRPGHLRPARNLAFSIDTASSPKLPITTIATGETTPAELVTFARSLTGTPYKYGSTDPLIGFDCSGFVTYVFNHFGINVPRSSADFMFVEGEIDIRDAKPGDIILFTGTDPSIRTGGHIGIIVSNDGDQVTFIHSSSGKALGVVETPLNAYYLTRYLKTIRVFAQNN